jgi:hypothetical protein
MRPSSLHPRQWVLSFFSWRDEFDLMSSLSVESYIRRCLRCERAGCHSIDTASACKTRRFTPATRRGDPSALASYTNRMIALSWVLLFVASFLLTFAIMWGPVSRLLRAALQVPLAAGLAAFLLMELLVRVYCFTHVEAHSFPSANKLTVRNGRIRNRSIFAVYEFVSLFFNLYCDSPLVSNHSGVRLLLWASCVQSLRSHGFCFDLLASHRQATSSRSILAELLTRRLCIQQLLIRPPLQLP